MSGFQPFAVGGLRPISSPTPMPVVSFDRIWPAETIAPLKPQSEFSPAELLLLKHFDRAIERAFVHRSVKEGPFIPPRAAKPSDYDDGVPLASILDIVARATDVSVIGLKSHSRDHPVTKARQIACWLGRRFTLKSLPQIGNVLGGRDHTTVLHACRRVAAVAERITVLPEDDTPEVWAAALHSTDWSEAVR
jgi:hypothetical protein